MGFPEFEWAGALRLRGSLLGFLVSVFLGFGFSEFADNLSLDVSFGVGIIQEFGGFGCCFVGFLYTWLFYCFGFIFGLLGLFRILVG